MTEVFPFFGNSEIQVLAVVGSILLVLTHAVTAICTKEKVVVATRFVMPPFGIPQTAQLCIQALKQELHEGTSRYMGERLQPSARH